MRSESFWLNVQRGIPAAVAFSAWLVGAVHFRLDAFSLLELGFLLANVVVVVLAIITWGHARLGTSDTAMVVSIHACFSLQGYWYLTEFDRGAYRMIVLVLLLVLFMLWRRMHIPKRPRETS